MKRKKKKYEKGKKEKQKNWCVFVEQCCLIDKGRNAFRVEQRTTETAKQN